MDDGVLARASAGWGGKGNRTREKVREKSVAVVHILGNECIDTSLCATRDQRGVCLGGDK